MSRVSLGPGQNEIEGVPSLWFFNGFDESSFLKSITSGRNLWMSAQNAIQGKASTSKTRLARWSPRGKVRMQNVPNPSRQLIIDVPNTCLFQREED